MLRQQPLCFFGADARIGRTDLHALRGKGSDPDFYQGLDALGKNNSANKVYLKRGNSLSVFLRRRSDKFNQPLYI